MLSKDLEDIRHPQENAVFYANKFELWDDMAKFLFKKKTKMKRKFQVIF